MKILLILLILTTQSFSQEPSKHVDLENISTKGLDKNVAKAFKETKKLILESRQKNDKPTELLGTKQWCYLLHNFAFLEQAKACYYLIGLDAKSEASWPYLYGKAALQQGNITDAIMGFEQTVLRDINYLPAYYYLIQLAIEQGNLLSAFEYQSKLPTNLKLTANMLNITGDLFSQVENYYVAIGYYQQALALVPNADSLNNKIGQNYQTLGDFEQAELFLKKSGKTGISLPDPYFQQVKDTTVGEIPYLIKAKTAINNSDFKNAIKLYNKALEFNPNSVSAKINSAVAYFQDNQIEKAKSIFEQLNNESPNNLKVLYNLGIIAKVQNKISQAIQYFSDYRNINPQDKAVNIELAELYYISKEYEKVIEISNEKQMATDETAQILKAKSLVYLEDYSQALELLTEINQYKPNNNEVLLMLSKLYSQVPELNLRNGELALQFARQAIVNEANQLSYWQLLMALDETKNCNELDQTLRDFAQFIKVEKQQVLSQLLLQRGDEFRCKID